MYKRQLIEYRQLFEQGESTLYARKQLLLGQREMLRERISELNASLEKLDKKLKWYDDVISERKKEC